MSRRPIAARPPGRRWIRLAGLLAALALPMSTLAHYPWIMPPPEPRRTAPPEVAFGHPFSEAGGMVGSRANLDRVLSCRESRNAMKAITTPEHGLNAAAQPVGHALELLLLDAPRGLAVGRPLRVQALFGGEPLAGEISVTHENHPARDDDDYALTLSTDAAGIAGFTPDNAGVWVLRMARSDEYPEPEVCDVRLHRATLTLPVR